MAQRQTTAPIEPIDIIPLEWFTSVEVTATGWTLTFHTRRVWSRFGVVGRVKCSWDESDSGDRS